MSFTDPNDVSATCTAAADLIEANGLFRGSYWGRSDGLSRSWYEPGMPLCTLGAIRVATGQYNDQEDTGTRWTQCAATTAVREEVKARLDVAGAGCISAWSDAARSADDVVSLLRDVAAKHQPDEYRSGSPG